MKNTSSPSIVRSILSGSHCESLESRTLLSGNVMASMVGGSLMVRGDTGTNAIVIDQAGLSAGQVRITGIDGTVINGEADPVVLDGVTQNATIRMGAADNSVTLNNLTLPGNATIRSGGGTDTVSINDVEVAGSLLVTNGNDRGTTTLLGTTVAGDLAVRAGIGGKDVTLQSVEVQRNTRIAGTRRGALDLIVEDSTFRGSFRVHGTNAADTVVVDSSGAPLGAATVYDGLVSIDLKGADDVLQLGIAGESGNRAEFAADVHGHGGPGRDTLRNFDATTYGDAARFRFTAFESNALIPDTTAPSVSSSTPAPNATDVPLNQKIAVVFSEAMDPATVVPANVTLTAPGGAAVSGTVAYVGTTMTFTPASPLAANTLYTTTVTTGARDLAGNALGESFVSSFTTGVTSDATAPTVSSTSPAPAATGVALNKKVTATFSEAMDPQTMTAANVTLATAGGIPVAGAVTYVDRTVTFTPASPLAASTTYTASIGTGAADLSGNPLAGAFTWGFTTGTAADTTAPTVTSRDPAVNATGVALNKKVTATFSEAMDPATITVANITVRRPDQSAVAGIVSYVGTTMTFTPASPLAASTTYTVRIAPAVRDLAGNPLAAAVSWNFTTGATADTAAPTVSSTNPSDLQTNVVINKTVEATFSEAMDPLTISTGTFALTGPGSATVNGTVDYDVATSTLAFVPSSNLTANTTYTARISSGANGVKDLAGNALASDRVWSFTTGTQIAQAPIELNRAAPFAVMARASIVSTGATQINGDVGLNPGTAQGIPPAQVNGTIHVTDQTIIDAQSDLLAAYNDAVSRTVTSQALPGNMGGLTFTPGLYTNSTSVLISGAGPLNNVTLDAQGDPDAIFIFKMGSTLTTGPGAQVILAGGAKAGNIFWQVGTSATLDTTTIFKGNILAAVTITVNTGSVVEGRLLAGSNSDGSVTVNASTITVPTT